MTTKQLLIAGVLLGTIMAGHTLLHMQLVSFIIAPLVLAIWLSYLPEPSEWLIFGLAAVTELFSGTPPGMMAVAILLPLAIRSLIPKLKPNISVRYLAIVLSIAAIQVIGLATVSGYRAGVLTVPFPASILAALGVGLTAYVVVNIWYEFGIEAMQ